MFYAGIVLDENHRDYGFVVIEKVIRRAKKEYVVHDARLMEPSDNSAGTMAFIRSLYQDDRYLRKKKVFSQSKRPAKNTYTPPCLLIYENHQGTPVIKGLRESQVPVDAFLFHDKAGWECEDMKILRQGRNYRLHPDEMNKLFPVLEKPGVTIAPECTQATALKEEMERLSGSIAETGACPEVFTAPAYRLLPPLFLALWHCRTIRQVKRY